MDIRPILSALRRHKTAAILIVLQIALSCAIICNALFLISGRIERMNRPTGLADAELVRVRTTSIGPNENADAQARVDLDALRAIPGVKSVAITNQIPFDGSSWNTSVSTKPDQPSPTLSAGAYIGTEDLLETYGVKLVAGRDFLPGEYQDFSAIQNDSDFSVPAVIITREMAEAMFPGQNPIGKRIHDGWGSTPIPVVGVVERMIRASDNGPKGFGYSMVLPIRPADGRYLLRTEPSRRAEVLKAAVAALERTKRNRIILDHDSFPDIASEYYRQDKSMVWLLASVCAALLVVTALGIVGLASFWVQQRTKQIGVRRALGATRAQILHYFQTENFLLTSIGIVLGMLGAFGLNQLLMAHYELPRLPSLYLPIGAVALWLLGQVAVFGPARRAAAVPPAIATRSV